MAEFIVNGGEMQLICSSKLSRADIEEIEKLGTNPGTIIANQFIQELNNLEDKFIEDHVRAFGWMLANDRLDLKIAIVREENGMFHQKVGIWKDLEGNALSFSGSANESASGLTRNIEEFKVFRNWIDSEKEYYETDEKRFDKFWNSDGKRTEVIDLPEAIKKKLIEISPDNIDELDLKKWLNRSSKNKHTHIQLFEHQEKAIKNWFHNDKKGILEMATGTGKTFTALGCLKKLLTIDNSLVAVIACPYDHLVKQWESEVKGFGLDVDTIIADSTNPKWKDEMTDLINDIKIGLRENFIVLTTHTTFSSQKFIDIIRKSKGNIFLVADEVHGLGAEKRQNGLIGNYTFRLGLSATPTRWFDEEGTEKIYDFFGNTVYTFSLKEAISTINPVTGLTYLTPYEYKPYFIELNDDEMDEYLLMTEKLTKLYNYSHTDADKEKMLQLLSIKRQKIIKNAANKYNSFIQILEEVGEIKHCLVYCLPEQIETIQGILNQNDIIHHKFTAKEGTKPDTRYGGVSERTFLLNKFADGIYDSLVAMKCLDEGVDVPPAKTAIIMASSGNPREYIQRAGRILRRYPGKNKAVIYDIVVIPPISNLIDNEFAETEKKIVKKELTRYKEFAYNAINKIECLQAIDKIEERYSIFVTVGE